MVLCKQYSQAIALAHALYSGGVGGKVLFMFSARFDDSGTHTRSLNVTVGGFVAEVGQWIHLEREWNDLLQEFGLIPSPGYFHMTDFEARVKPYNTWDNAKRRDFIQKLTGIIKRRANAGIAASLPTHNFEKMVVAMPPDSFPVGYQYYMCAQVCWKNIGAWANRYYPEETSIASIFEEGTAGKGLVLEGHADLIRNHKDIARESRLGALGFAFKEESPSLQAADFFAYETYKRMIENITDVKRWRKSVELIVSDIPIYATFLDDDVMPDIVKNLTEWNRARSGI